MLWLLIVGSGQPCLAAARRAVVIGYLPVARPLDDVLPRIDMSSFSHVNIAFGNPGADGRMIDGDQMSCMPGMAGVVTTTDRLKRLVAQIHAAGAKAMISLGGGVIPACAGDWTRLARPASRQSLITAIVDMADRLEMDGVDIDLEGPLLTTLTGQGDFGALVAGLSTALHRRGKSLSGATASYEGGMIPISAIKSFDLINVMSYDTIGPGWGNPGDEHATLATATADLALWLARGVRRDRLTLGVPFYGYGFGALQGTYSYRDLYARYGADATSRDIIGNRCAGCDYITFNGAPTLSAKGRLARQNGAGVMIWDITQDSDQHILIAALLGPKE